MQQNISATNMLPLIETTSQGTENPGTLNTKNMRPYTRWLASIYIQASLLLCSPALLTAASPALFGVSPPSHESKIAIQAAIGADGDGSGVAFNYGYSFSGRFSAALQLGWTDDRKDSRIRGELAAKLLSIGESSVSLYSGIAADDDGPSVHGGIWAHLYTGLPLFLVAGLETSYPDFDPEKNTSSLVTGIEIPVAVNLGFSLLRQFPLTSDSYNHYATGLIVFF